MAMRAFGHHLLSRVPIRTASWLPKESHFARSQFVQPSARYGTHTSQPPAPITKIEKIILDTIKATGPISFAHYMQTCLSHPTNGYYMDPSHNVFGSRGDFITSPEISQVFGELMGIWFLSQWMSTDRTKRIRLVELGPGRGTLTEDILRVLSQFPAARAAVSKIDLIETSQSLQTVQKDKLLPIAERNGWNLAWHTSLDDLPRETSEFSMIVAHEFFDALPFHLLQKTSDGWREVLVASTPDLVARDRLVVSPSLSSAETTPAIVSVSPRLRQVLSPSPTPSSTLLSHSSPRFQNLPVGSRLEVSPAAFKIARRIGEILQATEEAHSQEVGCALVVDYGGEKAYGNSFRGFKDHKIVDVFHRPGECDLTTNVDFAYLKEAFADLVATHGPLPQAAFLTRMGLQVRVDALKRAAKTEDRTREIGRAAERLIDMTGMGSQYQVLGVTGIRKGQPMTRETWPFVELKSQ